MISIKNLSKSFGEHLVLRDINIEIQKGEVISIIGPSGAGKTTFLRCLNLLDRPSGGEIKIDGENILNKNVDIYKIRQRMGMVFQSFNLFSHLMVIENVMRGPIKLLKMTRQEAYDDAMRLLDMVGLSEKALAYPEELSGGQKQRVAIARCLAMKPDIVLFDEPTSALDPTMVSEVLRVIRRLEDDGLTMMIITHEMKFARDVSHRVLYMDEGTIYEQGTPAQIFDHPQKEKTRAFIHKAHTYQFEIRSLSFDIYRISTEIEEFGRQHMLNFKQMYNIQLLIEEWMVGKLLPMQPRESVFVSFTLTCFEEKSEVALTFDYGGMNQNPLEQENKEDPSIMILTKLAETISYSRENECNRLKLILK